MSYDALLKAWQREKDSPELQYIEDRFLRESQDYVDALNTTSASQETLEGKTLRVERSYASRMLGELKKERVRKMVESIIRNQPVDAKALTPGERVRWTIQPDQRAAANADSSTAITCGEANYSCEAA